jgi:hypothetical protein
MIWVYRWRAMLDSAGFVNRAPAGQQTRWPGYPG